jgi:hypothetical protein
VSVVLSIFCAKGRGPWFMLHLRSCLAGFRVGLFDHAGLYFGRVAVYLEGRSVETVEAWVLQSIKRSVQCFARESRASRGVFVEGALITSVWGSKAVG